jgi:hypothetical protein
MSSDLPKDTNQELYNVAEWKPIEQLDIMIM